MKPTDLHLLGIAFALCCQTVAAAPAPDPPSTQAKRATTTPVTIEVAKVSSNTTALGLRPWPTKQYTVPIGDIYFLAINAEPYTLAPRPAIPAFQQFIYTFSDDIEAAYPAPSLSPRKASLEYYDTDSFTGWGISEMVHGLMCSQAPTEIVTKALSKLVIEVGRHGLPGRLHALIITERNLPWVLKWKPYNDIWMDIVPMNAPSLRANWLNATDNGFVATY